MTLYTWRALRRGWDEPNWRILPFWAVTITAAIGAVWLIAFQLDPPAWAMAVTCGALGALAVNAGAWMAGATRKPDMVDRIEAGEKPSLAEILEDLTGPREFLPTIPATQVEWSGPPPRKRPCWRCMTYRRKRQHFSCHKVVITDYVWLPESRDQD